MCSRGSPCSAFHVVSVCHTCEVAQGRPAVLQNVIAPSPTGLIFLRPVTRGGYKCQARVKPSGAYSEEHYYSQESAESCSITGLRDGAVREPLPSKPDRRCSCSAGVIKSPGPSTQFRAFLLEVARHRCSQCELACLRRLLITSHLCRLCPRPCRPDGRFSFLFTPLPVCLKTNAI